MRFLVLALVFLAIPASVHADEEPPPQGFPATWEGTWKGPCKLIRDGKTAMAFPMELHVKPLEGREGWTWRIVYDEGAKRQVRPYELLPVEGEPNHFRIDEKNSIVIDAYFENDHLHSRFWVGESVVGTTYARDGDTMVVTLTTYGAKPVTMTGGEKRVPRVASYELRSVQRGALKR